MNPIWRDRIVTVGASLLAVWLSFQLADGSLALPLAVASLAAAFVLVWVVGSPMDAIIVGFLLIGYIVANRGFAQLMPVPGLPLLPAEMGLAATTACLLWRCARERRLPWERNAVDHLLLAWILVGTARFAFDWPRFGFVALRDFATVYYVAFYFITRDLCREERTKRFLLRCLFAASALLPIVYLLFELFPGFFLGTLLVRGVPLIFFKGDLATTFLGLGGIVLFLGTPTRVRWLARPLAVVMLLSVFSSDARASTLGILVALGCIAVTRFRRFAWLQAGVACLALLLLAGFATFSENIWAVQKLRTVTERAKTVVDLGGRFDYQQEHSLSKSGNNQFRWVWWRTVAAETLAVNPALGLGFGYDLARGFLQEYNPELAEDFTARSPHNIMVTTLGRVGLVGLAIFVTFLAVLAHRTWRVLRDPDSDGTEVALWSALWLIIVSAHLGVVLEGPMGAVVFWSLLGLAHAYRPRKQEAEIPAGESADPLTAEPGVLETTTRRTV